MTNLVGTEQLKNIKIGNENKQMDKIDFLLNFVGQEVEKIMKEPEVNEILIPTFIELLDGLEQRFIDYASTFTPPNK